MKRRHINFIKSNHYEISDTGKCRRMNKRGRKWTPFRNYLKGNTIKTSMEWNSYISFCLSDGWKRKRYLAHRLVARAFLWLNINDTKIYICHKNDNPENNCVSNLFVWKPRENYIDMARKYRSLQKMTPQKIRQCFFMIENWVSQRECSRIFWVSSPAINKLRKQRWIYELDDVKTFWW